MRTHIALILVAMTSVAAMGVFMAHTVYAQQAGTDAVMLLSTAAPAGVILTHGPGGGGMHSGSMHSGSGKYRHFNRFNTGFGPYWPGYGAGGSYTTTNQACNWTGYKWVCYDQFGNAY
jgi:hypothetical protein